VESRGKLRINFGSHFVDLVYASAGTGSASFKDSPGAISIMDLVGPTQGAVGAFSICFLELAVGTRSENKVGPPRRAGCETNLEQPAENCYETLSHRCIVRAPASTIMMQE
jgi:hypothetical protein